MLSLREVSRLKSILGFQMEAGFDLLEDSEKGRAYSSSRSLDCIDEERKGILVYGWFLGMSRVEI